MTSYTAGLRDTNRKRIIEARGRLEQSRLAFPYTLNPEQHHRHYHLPMFF